MSCADLKVVTLYDSNHRDVPKTLRRIADGISQGDEGNVVEASVVIRRDDGTVDVFAIGDANETSAVALLEKGKFKIMYICAMEETK